MHAGPSNDRAEALFVEEDALILNLNVRELDVTLDEPESSMRSYKIPEKDGLPAGDHGSSQNLEDPSPHEINTSTDANLVDERRVGSFVRRLLFLFHCVPSFRRDRSDVAS